MKKLVFSALTLVTILSGCSTAYQSGQTPDDVYFSPGEDGETYAYASGKNSDDRYQEYVSTMDDRYLRMKVANRDRWGTIDNFSYWNDMRYDFSPFSFGYAHSMNPWRLNPYVMNPWNIGFNYYPGLNAWNNLYGGGFLGGSYYAPGVFGTGFFGTGGGYVTPIGLNNPFFSVFNYSNPKANIITSGAGSNLSALRNRMYNNSNSSKGGNWYAPGSNGSSNNFGNLVKRVFSTSSSPDGQSNSFDRAIRTFNNPSSSAIPMTNSNAGGSSGGFKSTGSSATSGRGGRN
ncbi:hypothetical protein [Sediminibacterium salmoneum]|uniref:hypothetical protein n=1 Tax=Sediminibacterium salmoneum TaxID=426421 RepID=UPI000478C431|nr:hypothetical protein [Sediminibacterium salmoneum]